MISYGLRYSFSVFFPTILAEFKWSRASTAGIFSLHLVSYGLISPISGRLADRFGPRRVIPVGAIIMGLGMMACSITSELWHFYLLYGVIVPVGICVSGWSQFVPTIARWFKKRRATALGLASAGFALSFLLSSLTAPLIVFIGWRGTFVVLGILPIAIIAPLSAFLLRTSPEDMGIQPEGNELGQTGVDGASRLECTVQEAMRDYRFWAMFFAFFLVWGIGQSTIVAHQVAFIHDLGYSETVAAIVLALFGVIEVLGNLSSSLADKYRRERVYAVGALGLMASVVILMLTSREGSGTWMLYTYAIFFGFFNGLAGPVLSAIPADQFQGRNFGSINGILMLGFGLGGALGPLLGGLIFDATGTYTPVLYMVLFCFPISAAMMWVATNGRPRRDIERALARPKSNQNSKRFSEP
jgi:MFS family permease